MTQLHIIHHMLPLLKGMFVYSGSAVYSVFPQNTVTEYKSLNAIIHDSRLSIQQIPRLEVVAHLLLNNKFCFPDNKH